MACILPLPHEDNVLNKFRIWKERRVQMREPYQSPSDEKLILLYRPVGDRTHDFLHTVASNMVKVSHALNHSATAAVIIFYIIREEASIFAPQRLRF